jgi:predicted TIM-barrel fold metal-dependent hydrolase
MLPIHMHSVTSQRIVVDCCCGIGPWARRAHGGLPYRGEEICGLMDYYGVEQAVVYSNLAAHYGWPPDGNAYTVTACSQMGGRLIPAFVLAPHAHARSPDAASYADAMRRAGAKAAWLWPQQRHQSHGLCDWVVQELLDMLTAYRIPLFLSVYQCSPSDLDRLFSAFPSLPVVLSGMSYEADCWLYPLMRRHASVNVCLAPSYVPYDGVKRFVQAFGGGRLLFGSGLPHATPGGVLAHVMYADIGPRDREAILGGNAQRLMAEVAL